MDAEPQYPYHGPTYFAFHYHRLRRELSNYALLKTRRVDGQLVSQHQSGTHWLKYMMASALSRHLALPPPQYNHANDYIGGPKDPVVYPKLPKLVSSHSIPAIGFALAHRSGLLHLPKYVLLVRDIRASLVSNYRKWEQRYAVSFSTFLRGDPSGQKYNSDIWWSIRFLNAWGYFANHNPGRVFAVHYEGLNQDPQAILTQIFAHLEIEIHQSDIDHAINVASKGEMRERADPTRPPGEVHLDQVDIYAWFSAEDRAYFSAQTKRYLKQAFNYDYTVW